MMLLQDILYKVGIRSLTGSTAVQIHALHIDSRQVQTGSCFIALKGSLQDGHAHIEDAVRRGAVAVVCESMPADCKAGVAYVETGDTAAAAGTMADTFFGHPSSKIKLVGVTGTNGKTTVATLLYSLFNALGYTAGLISTVHNRVGMETIPSTHTTPDVISLHALLKKMVDAGCTHGFMEVSSHAVHQQRIAGVVFSGAVFTNITHDHLDYHKTFDEYIRVKKSFFDHLPSGAFAISNLDDRNGSLMLQNTLADKRFYSLRSIADFKGRIIDNSMTGLQMLVNEQDVHFRLVGEFNAYNILAVYGVALSLGLDRFDVLPAMSALLGAEGRFDIVFSAQTGITGIVDYAHTPDALLNVLSTIKKIQKDSAQLITVVGCGGDRDRTKRKSMGSVAAQFSNKTIFTADNPRSEDPASIIQDMLEDMDPLLARKVISIADRKEAIKTAVLIAGREDIVLVAGKGHEKYQEIKGVRHPFDDKQVLQEALNNLEKI
jgi:UDP-N-acetylmuramoyl-L-alanyl-D-glutamate--2,6-diaminopimelate ligase